MLINKRRFLFGARPVCFRSMATFGIAAGLCAAPDLRGERLIYHDIKTDAAGKIVPWSGPPSQAYDHVVRLIWKFWSDMQKCENGLPYYMQHMIWSPDRHGNGLGGDQIPMALSSWNLLYGYLGDEAVKQNMMYMADYWLDHGLSKPTDAWANSVYTYDTVRHSGVYDGDMVAGKGVLQPDKVASFASRTHSAVQNDRQGAISRCGNPDGGHAGQACKARGQRSLALAIPRRSGYGRDGTSEDDGRVFRGAESGRSGHEAQSHAACFLYNELGGCTPLAR